MKVYIYSEAFLSR